MNFKTATTLGMIGSVLLVLVQLLYSINSLNGNWDILGIPGYLVNIISLLGSILILLFFISLNKKQS